MLDNCYQSEFLPEPDFRPKIKVLKQLIIGKFSNHFLHQDFEDLSQYKGLCLMFALMN